mmetsp:Transcript_34112/g.102009  ORF Transcript_34112/g.102009 Transcript_34112/m.102009 type:complete len:243 (-) Transcript_34112:272-1000(-)
MGRLARTQIPQVRDAPVVGRRAEGSVRMESDPVGGKIVTVLEEELRPRGNVPETEGVIVGGGADVGSRGVEGRRAEAGGVTAEVMRLLDLPGLLLLALLLPPGGGRSVAAGVAHLLVVVPRGRPVVPAARPPYLPSEVDAGRGQHRRVLPVPPEQGAHGDARDAILVAEVLGRQGLQCGGRTVPQPDGPRPAPRGDPVGVAELSPLGRVRRGTAGGAEGAEGTGVAVLRPLEAQSPQGRSKR